MLKTSDLEIFKYRSDNRDLFAKHIEQLVASLKQYDDLHLHPIIVNKEFEVIDGQHRLEAAKILKKEIYYLIDENFEPNKMINIPKTQRSWVLDDYINFYCVHGNEDYIKLRQLVKDIDWNISTLLVWIGDNSGSSLKRYKSGKFKFNLTQKKLENIIYTKKFLQVLKEMNFRPLNINTQSGFHLAMKKFLYNDIVDKDRFIEQIKKCSFSFKYMGNWQDYLLQFVGIYNWNKRSEKLKYIIDKGNIEISI